MLKLKDPPLLPRAFWLVWMIEFWERFGYYGMQAIITLYFVQKLGYTEKESFDLFGTFVAFVYGFIWLGGWVGDVYFGMQRTLVLGAVFLLLSYVGLAFSNTETVFYALGGIVVGNALFKANPSALIASMYPERGRRLDSAMTYYYMAVNLGSLCSIAITPIIVRYFSWQWAFIVCAIGLGFGLINYFVVRDRLDFSAELPSQDRLNLRRLMFIVLASVGSIIFVAQLLHHLVLSRFISYFFVVAVFIYFLKVAFGLSGTQRTRMLVAFVLLLEAILFFVLYNQMPTSLTFFALHHVDNHFFAWTILPAQYQLLNPVGILLVSPILAYLYGRFPSTHVTKFCIGMTLYALAFLLLALSPYVEHTVLVSPLWLVGSYFFQSMGELLISALGLAMVANLCPREKTGFVMGVWFLTNLVAGPLIAWVADKTTLESTMATVSVGSLKLYCTIFLDIGLVTGALSLFMWLSNPFLNRLLIQNDHEFS